MRILALDLGTKTGWALWDGLKVTSGTWVLATKEELRRQKLDKLDRCCDMRPARLLERIHKINSDVIAFEDVQFLSTQLQSQLWASLRAMVTLQYSLRELIAVPVGTLKKFATGHGNATKEMMRLAAIGKGYATANMDDNEIDALHLLGFARDKVALKGHNDCLSPQKDI